MTMRTLMLCSVLLATGACFAQGALAPSVVMGQNAAGQNEVLTVLPLKFLDPGVAANLLIALGYPGVVIPLSVGPRPGGFEGAYQSQSGNRRGGSRPGGGSYGNNASGNQGYGGYQDALQRGGQYPGYQSPFGNQ